MPSTIIVPPAVLTKLAAGDVQTFENSLATIGRSFLSPKAPALFQHEIGFQVLDQDDDNQRAVGVFGFRIGDRLYYVPMFYRNGQVKGTEQLRDPKRKRTVPLSDNWVNKLLSERGDDPPELISRAKTKDTSLPSLWQLKYPPTKYAKDLKAAEPHKWAAFLRDVRADLGTAITGAPRPPADPTDDLFKVAGEYPAILAGIGRMLDRYDWFGQAVLRYHGAAKVASALSAVTQPSPRTLNAVLGGSRLVPLVNKKAGAASVTVIRVRAVDLRKGPGLAGLDFSPDDLGELKAGKNAYRDKRKDTDVGKVTAWIGGLTNTGERLSNPTDSGVYEVLGADHTYIKAVVLTNLLGSKPDVFNKVLIVRPGDNGWTVADRNAVWVRNEDAALNPDRESGEHGALHAWAEKLPEIKENIPSGRYSAISLISPGTVTATAPFDRWGDDGECYMSGCGHEKAPFWAPHDPRGDQRHNQRYDDPRGTDGGPTRVSVFPDSGHARPAIAGRTLYLPPTARLVKLDGPRLSLGSGSDPERALFAVKKKAGEQQVGISRTAGGWVVEGPGSRALKTAHIEDAEALLVTVNALRPTDARRLTELAASSLDKRASAWVKYADPRYGLAHNSPNSPHLEFDQYGVPASFADDVVPSESSVSAAVPIDDMLPQPGANDRYRPYPQDYGTERPLPGIGNGNEPPSRNPGESDLRAISDAAASGKRELFDTAALAALVKYTRLQSLLERVRARTQKTVSDLADLLAHMYWNTDEWTEQYGQTEIGPMEDQLRSQFEGLGDLFLRLQEKTVEGEIDTGILPDAAAADGAD